MTPDQLEEFKKFTEQAIKDTAVHVKNSSERTNSSLVAEIMHKLEKELEPVVNRLINGKINNLTEMQKEQNIVLETIKTQVEKITNDTTPLVEKSKEVTILHKYVGKFGSTIVKVASVVTAVTVIAVGLITVIRYIK